MSLAFAIASGITLLVALMFHFIARGDSKPKHPGSGFLEVIGLIACELVAWVLLILGVLFGAIATILYFCGI